MASIFAGSDHIAHVRTQIPYARVPVGIRALLYVASMIIYSVWLLLAVGLLVQFVMMMVLGRLGRGQRSG